MAKLSSSEYSQLDDVSNNKGAREAGPFVPIFISVEPRKGQKPGHMHCHIFDRNISILSNKEEVRFICMFIKKIRELTIGKDEDKNRQLVYFSWDPDRDTNYPKDAKVQYIIAGLLVDENMKVIHDPRTEDQPTMCYFRCKGIKMTSAIDYLKALEEKGKQLEPLSDNAQFEKSVITPRRFVTCASITTQSSAYGEKYIFKFTPEKLLPDSLVIGDENKVGIMKQCMQWKDRFKKQFDLSEEVKVEKTEEPKKAFNMPASKDEPKFSDSNSAKAAPENSVKKSEVEFDLGLSLGSSNDEE